MASEFADLVIEHLERLGKSSRSMCVALGVGHGWVSQQLTSEGGRHGCILGVYVKENTKGVDSHFLRTEQKHVRKK